MGHKVCKLANFVDREALQEREQKFYKEYPMDTLKLQPLFSTTKYGMPIYKDQHEAIHSESSITLPIEINNKEKFITVSSIWPSDPEGKPSGSKELTGKYWKDDELRPFIRDNLSENKKFFINPITQERVPVFNTDREANKYALDRDMSLQNVSEYRQDHIFQKGGNVMAEDNDNNNQQIYTRKQMDKATSGSWGGQDFNAPLPEVNVGGVSTAVSLRDDWMDKKPEEPLTNREKEISAYLRIFTENPNPPIDIANESQMRALEILNQIPHTAIQTGGAAMGSILSNPDDPKNKAFINANKRVLVQAFPILSKSDELSGRGSFVKPQFDVGVGHQEQLQHQQGLVKKQPYENKLKEISGDAGVAESMHQSPQTKREKQFGSGSTERKDDFHDTEGLAARGGLIGYQMGAEVQTNPMRMGSEDTGSAGFIGTTKEGREDRAMALQNGDMGTDGVDATVDEGSFVLNSWAVALAGRQYIEELVKKAKQYIASPEGRAQLGNRELQPEEIDIRVSNGEYVFPPAMVEIIGRERLEKMNNRGIQAFEEEQRERPQEAAMTMQESEGLVPRPDQIPQNPAQEGDFDELEAMSQQQIGAHRGGTIRDLEDELDRLYAFSEDEDMHDETRQELGAHKGGTIGGKERKGIIRELEELFYGFEPEPEPKSMLLVMGEKDEKNESPSKQLGGFVSNNGSKKNYARGDLVSISPPIPEMKPTPLPPLPPIKDNSFVHRSGSIPLHSEVSGKSKVLEHRKPREAHIEQVAKIIYGEGRGEKEEGMKAIAHVIRNRLNRDKKRSTKEFTNGYFYQSVVAKPLAFSVTNPNLKEGTKEYANQQNMEEAYKNYKDPSKKSDEEFLRAIQIARDLFQNNLGKDITKGAVMYHSATMKQQDVNWNFKQLYETIRIGDHIFYNYRDSRPEMKPQKFDDGGFVKELLKKYDKSSKITEPVLGLIQSGKKLKDIYDKSGFEISIKNKGKISKKGNISDILPVNTKGQYNLEVDPIRKDAYVKFTIPFST